LKGLKDHSAITGPILASAAALCIAAVALSPTVALAQTLTILSSMTAGNSTGDQMAKTVAAFEAASGIDVQVEEVNNDDVATTFEASALAGEEADIVILNLTPTSADWLPNGLVVEVSQYFDQWGFKDRLQPAAVDYWTNENGMNGFPFLAFNWPIWYNTALLEKAGVASVPATFDELLAAAKALRAAGVQPFALGGKDWTAQNFITWLGQQYIAPEKAAEIFTGGKWCDPDVVKGLDLLAAMRDGGVFVDNVAGYDGDQMTNAFFTGAAAMMPSGSWAYTNTPAEIAEVTELAGFPVPNGGHYDKPTAYNGFNTGFFVTRGGADNIDAVGKFLQFIYTPENLKSWVSEASQVLAVTGDAVAGASSDAPLVVKGSQVTDDNTSYLLLPDGYLPANTDWGPTVASEFLGQTGTTGADLCQKLEQQYSN
jgi:multiple sugar transport system substrate-binding protein